MASTAQRNESFRRGIFRHELCITLAGIFEEILTHFVREVYQGATATYFQDNARGEPFHVIYERGLMAIDSWSAEVKQYYKQQVAVSYPWFNKMFGHAYLMFVREFFGEASKTVEIRVVQPSMATVLYTFLRNACHDQTVISAEYLTRDTYLTRAVFVEAIVRRLLYELLFQQNNVRGIVAHDPPAAPAAAPASPSPNAHRRMEVRRDMSLESFDLQPGGGAAPRGPRGFRPPTVASVAQPAPAPPPAHRDHGHTPVPALPPAIPATPVTARAAEAAAPWQPAAVQRAVDALPAASSVAKPPAAVPPAAAPGALLPAAAPPPRTATPVLAPAPPAATPALAPLPPTAAPTLAPATNAAAPPVAAAPSTAHKPTVTEVTAKTAASGAATPTTHHGSTASPRGFFWPNDSTTSKSAAPAPPELPSNLFAPTASEAPSATTAATTAVETDVVPAGTRLPPPPPPPHVPTAIPSESLKGSTQNSLDLPPSEQDFGAQVKRILDAPSTGTVVPGDSVTQIAEMRNNLGGHPLMPIRKSLFMPGRSTGVSQ